MLLGSHDNTVMEIRFGWKGETQVLSTVALNEGRFQRVTPPFKISLGKCVSAQKAQWLSPVRTLFAIHKMYLFCCRRIAQIFSSLFQFFVFFFKDSSWREHVLHDIIAKGGGGDPFGSFDLLMSINKTILRRSYMMYIAEHVKCHVI